MHTPTRLFHLHFNTPDVSGAEARLADHGLPLYRRFGHIDGEFHALEADDPTPKGFRLRLQNAERGYANITLAPGTCPHFDHLGLCTSEFDAICDRAEDAGWSIRDRDGRRTFIMTPWRFRVELHPNGSDVEAALGSWDKGHFERVELTTPETDGDEPTNHEFESVFGTVPGLSIRQSDDVQVPRFRLDGSAFSDAAWVETVALL
ncbi:VOC family protein [Haladaptatus sp. DFWS20]|uniref:VOC family protein n=1 Tax=Haladaptatus sp. DFWS20 TaxID=3403467 RepID=UPI003EBEA4DA